MMPPSANSPKTPVDARVAIYRFVKYALVLLACAFLIKFTLFDTLVIKTDQMSPALVEGDRVVLLRPAYLWPFSLFLTPRRGAPVVVKHPLLSKSFACLRVAGQPGDSMVIGKGIFRINNKTALTFGGSIAAADALLPEFTPRDSMEAYCLPCPGDTINLDSLSLRDFFFALAMIRQEHPGRNYTVKADLSIDGKSANDVPMANFSLYKGTLDTIPEKFGYNWFFWDRMHAYWVRAAAGKNCQLRFGLFHNKDKIAKYGIRESFIFLLADDWQKGFDSRYFGPVSSRSIKGRVVCILWSIARGSGWFRSLRTDRIMKIVR